MPTTADVVFVPEQGPEFNAKVLRNTLDDIFMNLDLKSLDISFYSSLTYSSSSDVESHGLVEEVDTEEDLANIRVVLNDAIITERDFIKSEPFAQQVTLEELALGEEEFFRRRRYEKKRISKESDHNRSSHSSSSSSSSGSTMRKILMNAAVRNIVPDCLANRCGTKVTIWSPEYVRWKIISAAFDVLRSRPSFSDIYSTDRAQTIVRHINGKMYAVLVPFTEDFYDEF